MITLPEYVGGIISPEIYNSGVGLCDNRKNDPNVIPHFTDGMKVSEDEFRALLTKLDDDNIFFHYQYAPAGKIGIRMYYPNHMAEVIYSDNTVSAHILDEFIPMTEEDVTVKTITATNVEEFNSYGNELEKAGFKLTYSLDREKNMFREYKYDGGIVRCNYVNGTVRIINDTVSIPVAEFGDEGGIYGSSIAYQYGLHHARNRAGFTMDCGMCYVIKLPDSSILMIDGGEYEQCTAEATEGLMSLLHELGGEKIRLNWFCTHAHDDHMDMFAHILRLHHDEIDLRRVMFNYPSDTNYISSPNPYMTIRRILNYYPDVKYRKLHMGDSFTLGGCLIDVLQTHEESTSVIGNECIGGFNDTSTVLRINLDSSCVPESRFIVLGDIDGSAEKILITNWTADTLKAGMVQTAHHLFNYLEYVYDVIDADYALVPQTERVRVNHDKKKYELVLKTVPYDNFRFSDSGTDGFAFVNGKLTPVDHRPRLGGVYDGSEL